MYIHQRHIRQDGKRSRGKDVSECRYACEVWVMLEYLPHEMAGLYFTLIE